MPFEIITIPFDPVGKSFHADDLNKFCLNKKVVNKKVEFFHDGEKYFWSVFVEYETILETSSGNDTTGLTQAGRLCYERIKAWRKETANNFIAN